MRLKENRHKKGYGEPHRLTEQGFDENKFRLTCLCINSWFSWKLHRPPADHPFLWTTVNEGFIGMGYFRLLIDFAVRTVKSEVNCTTEGEMITWVKGYWGPWNWSKAGINTSPGIVQSGRITTRQLNINIFKNRADIVKLFHIDSPFSDYHTLISSYRES